MQEPRHVLILVHDSEMLAQLCEMLPPTYLITAERRPIRAVHRLSHQLFDLLILDLDLPDARHAEFVNHVRRHSARSNIPIIVLSMDLPGHRRLFGESVRVIVGKPVASDLFIAGLKSLLPRMSLPRTERAQPQLA